MWPLRLSHLKLTEMLKKDLNPLQCLQKKPKKKRTGVQEQEGNMVLIPIDFLQVAHSDDYSEVLQIIRLLYDYVLSKKFLWG